MLHNQSGGDLSTVNWRKERPWEGAGTYVVTAELAMKGSALQLFTSTSVRCGLAGGREPSGAGCCACCERPHPPPPLSHSDESSLHAQFTLTLPPGTPELPLASAFYREQQQGWRPTPPPLSWTSKLPRDLRAPAYNCLLTVDCSGTGYSKLGMIP